MKSTDPRPDIAYLVDGQPSNIPGEDSITFYVGINGLTCDTEDGAVGKLVNHDTGMDYYLRVCNAGAEQGRLVNPRGMYFRPEHLSSADARLGRERYVFMRVPQDVFQMYTNFLKSRNELHLREAERKLLDG